MIAVNSVVSWAMRKLGLFNDPTFDYDDARIAIADVLAECKLAIPTAVTRTTVTTVAGQSEYRLPDTVGIIERILWPTEWKDSVPRRVTTAQLEGIRQQVAALALDYNSSAPNWYAVLPLLVAGTGNDADANYKVLAFERAASVTADLIITVEYYDFSYSLPNIDVGQGQDAPSLMLDVTMSMVLRYGTTFHLAESYAIDKAAYFKNEYELAKSRFFSAQSQAALDTTAVQTEVIYIPD